MRRKRENPSSNGEKLNKGIYYYTEESDEIECPECNGTGYDPLDGGQCDRCNGTGVIDR